MSGEDAARLAAGIRLRSYTFDKYKTKKDEADGNPTPRNPSKFTIHCANPAAAKKAFADLDAVVDGVNLARDLVNEPANKLGPVEFAAEAKALEKLGVKVEILTEKEMTKLGMGALLGVAQGSPRGARMAVMQWNGGKAKQKPIAFVGKGVTFDTGGNSIKPAAGMEDMKGDMGGAAAVVGLMRALAGAQGQGQCRRHHRAGREHRSTAMPSARATSSRRCRARPSRSSTPTPRDASCWPTRSGTATSASSRSSWSISRR